MILSCHNINKAFLEQVIIKDGSFKIEDREKVALIGANGAGKSTLLKMIVGELAPDSGSVILAKGSSIGYLSQHQVPDGDHTVIEEMKMAKQDLITLETELRCLESRLSTLSGEELHSALDSYHKMTQRFEQNGGYAFRSEIVGVLKGLGFFEETFDKPISALSGGEKTRVALGKLLLLKPDILLLDEPTNHLDLNSINWLETYLINYPGAVLLVSHDRYFLNRVVTKVIEIENGQIVSFEGNYSAFSTKKEAMREAQLKAYLKQQQEIAHQEQVISKLRSFNREKSIRRAQSREKMLEKMERLDAPMTETPDMQLVLRPQITSGKDVLCVKGLSKGFVGHPLFSQLDFEIKRGEHVAIIGDNGTGKTTLLKIINGLLPADEGEFTLGSKVMIGYYDQEHQVLSMEKTIFEEISDAYPSLTNTQIRNTLAAFLFTGEDVYKHISKLSGGERGRVSLAKLMLSNANFLILDEPTNHLDIASKEILENALNEYTGTILYVSHDRYFINQTATRILELTGNTLINYIGNYDYYMEKRDILTKAYLPIEDSSTLSEEVSENKLDWQAQKEAKALERKQKSQLKKVEKEIEHLENRKEEIDNLLQKEEVYSNSVRCQELTQERKNILLSLEENYHQWEELALLLE